MIKKTTKHVGRKALVTAKKVAIKVPAIRRAGIKVKAVLFPGMSSVVRETYNFHKYYPSIEEYVSQQQTIFKTQPLISLVMPTYNTPENFLRECINSVMVQSYSNWELCIADDASPNKNVLSVIKEYSKLDKRIKFVERKVNGHISDATNSAIAISTGEYISLLDHDDILWPNALHEVVKTINENPKADLIYTDEDKIDTTGLHHSYPFLKPDWSPEFLESCNYITHFSTIRASLMKEIGGLRKGYEGAQDWDLFLRVTEITNHIVHIPKMLYSWRIHEDSTAANTDAKPYVYEAQRKLLSDHLIRTGRAGVVETGIITQHRTIKYNVDEDEILSVFVDYHSVKYAKRLAASLTKHAAGVKFELFFFHTDTISKQDKQDKQDTLIASAISNQHFLRLSKEDVSKKYTTALSYAVGNYLFFIDDRTEIASNDWAKTAIGDSQLEGVGLVAPLILLPGQQIIASAGVGIGYGPRGMIDMLNGQPFEDPHYARGLYAKSRRNVSAVNGAAYCISKTVLAEVVQKERGFQDVLELASTLLESGYRHVYTPYIRVIAHGGLPIFSLTDVATKEDRYLNPSFNHENQRMEVSA